jgi:hypothetical protein
LLAALAGCGGSQPTEVIVVLQSDLTIPTETDGLEIAVGAGPIAPLPSGSPSINEGTLLTGDFPVSLAFTPGGTTTSFSLTAQLLHNLSGANADPSSLVVSRTITDVPFFPHQEMMLVVPMLRACACHGTSCPGPGNPDCDDIARPTLQKFDPAVAPPSTLLFGAIEVDPLMFATH